MRQEHTFIIPTASQQDVGFGPFALIKLLNRVFVTPVSLVTAMWFAPLSAVAEEVPAVVHEVPTASSTPPAFIAPPLVLPPAALSPRVRFEVGIEGGFIESRYQAQGRYSDFPVITAGAGAGPGIYVRLGVQVKDWVSAQIEGSVGAIPEFAEYVRSALTVNFTPVHWFTVSGGFVVGDTATYVGGTLRADFHVYVHRSARGRRHSVTLGLGGDFGGAVTSKPYSGVIIGGMANLGYTLH